MTEQHCLSISIDVAAFLSNAVCFVSVSMKENIDADDEHRALVENFKISMRIASRCTFISYVKVSGSSVDNISLFHALSALQNGFANSRIWSF